MVLNGKDLGLVERQNPTTAKVSLERIFKMGDPHVHRLVVAVATSASRRAKTAYTQWGVGVRSLLERKPKPKRIVMVAIAKKNVHCMSHNGEK